MQKLNVNITSLTESLKKLFLWKSKRNQLRLDEFTYMHKLLVITLYLQALEKYKSAINIIDEALAIQVIPPDISNETWKEARKMIYTLKRMRGEVLVRITTLQQKHDTNQPFAMTDATDNKNNKPCTYNDLAEELRTLQVDETERTTKILFCCQNVKLYCISTDGSVTSTSESLELIIFQLTGCGCDNNVNVIRKSLCCR